MAKLQKSYACTACGNITSKWAGQCEACGEWNTLEQEAALPAVPKGLSAGKGQRLEWHDLSLSDRQAPRQETGIAELDRVTGGGLVAGSAILIGGDPGIGKSTLLLQAAVKLAAKGLKIAYISGEESTQQIALRAHRLGLTHPNVRLASATSIRDILSSLGAEKPDLCIIDSIQTMFVDNIEAAPGTVAQVRAASNELIRVAKSQGFILFIVGHVTKEGQIAGPRVLEHMVDVVLYFEGERGHAYRILRAVKNRYGGTDEIGVFSMEETGLQEVSNPSLLFLSDRENEMSGAAVFAGIEGSRPILVEIQALLSPSYMTSPRRAVVGWDANRLAMLLAVLETRGGLRFADKEVYLNVAGGFRVNEPAADLAVASALISALYDAPPAKKAIFFGELALSGEVRQVSRTENRLKEAEKLGFERAFCASPAKAYKGGIEIYPIPSIRHLLKRFES